MCRQWCEQVADLIQACNAIKTACNLLQQQIGALWRKKRQKNLRNAF